MSYKLFLDDYRNPADCVKYMHSRIGAMNHIYLQKWIVVRDYNEFIQTIKAFGIPSIISFDHDLEDERYPKDIYDDEVEKTGLDCAKWLKDYCRDNDLKLPDIIVHSMNPVGTENIIKHFTC